MQSNVNGASGSPNTKDGVDGLENETNVNGDASGAPNKDTVAYETYKKTLAEAKKYKDLYAGSNSRIDALEQGKLELEGNKDQLIESLKGRVKDMEGKNKELLGNFAFKALKSQVEAEAMKLGCSKPTVMEKLVDFGSIDVSSETFEADGEAVKMAVESVKTEYPEFFGKPSPKINTSTPSTDIGSEKQKDFSKMTEDELKAEIDRIDAAEGKHKNFVHR